MKIKHKLLGDPPIAFEELPDPPMYRERYSAASGVAAIPRGRGSLSDDDLAVVLDALQQLDWVVWLKSYLAALRGNGASVPPADAYPVVNFPQGQTFVPPADAITPATPPVPVSSPSRKAPAMTKTAPEQIDAKTLQYARSYREKLEQFAKKRMQERAAGLSWTHDDDPDATRRNAIQIRADGDKLVVEAIEAEDATRDARHALSKKALQRALRMGISFEAAYEDLTGEDIRSRPLIGSTAGLDPWSPAAPKTEIPRGTVGGRFG